MKVVYVEYRDSWSEAKPFPEIVVHSAEGLESKKYALAAVGFDSAADMDVEDVIEKLLGVVDVDDEEDFALMFRRAVDSCDIEKLCSIPADAVLVFVAVAGSAEDKEDGAKWIWLYLPEN